jgi:hypothetical protein
VFVFSALRLVIVPVIMRMSKKRKRKSRKRKSRKKKSRRKSKRRRRRRRRRRRKKKKKRRRRSLVFAAPPQDVVLKAAQSLFRREMPLNLRINQPKGNGSHRRTTERALRDGIGAVLSEAVSYYDLRESLLAANFAYTEVGKCYGNEATSVFLPPAEAVTNRQLSSSQHVEFGNELVSLGLAGLHGCSAVVVVSRRGAWVGHFWEGDTNDVATAFGTAEGPTNIMQYPLGRLRGGNDGLGSMFNDEYNPQVFILTSRIQEDGSTDPEVVAAIQSGLNSWWPGNNAGAPIVYDVARNAGRDPNFNNQKGKVLVQYQPASCSQDPEEAKARWRVWHAMQCKFLDRGRMRCPGNIKQLTTCKRITRTLVAVSPILGMPHKLQAIRSVKRVASFLASKKRKRSRRRRNKKKKRRRRVTKDLLIYLARRLRIALSLCALVV